MILKELIETMQDGTKSVLTELLHPYKKSLLTYYSREFNGPPVLMVTAVFNACSYAIVVPGNELEEAIETYLGENISEEDKEQAREEILFNSIPLSKF